MTREKISVNIRTIQEHLTVPALTSSPIEKLAEQHKYAQKEDEVQINAYRIFSLLNRQTGNNQ